MAKVTNDVRIHVLENLFTHAGRKEGRKEGRRKGWKEGRRVLERSLVTVLSDSHPVCYLVWKRV